LIIIIMFGWQLRKISYLGSTMKQTELAVYYVTAGGKEEATRIATALVERRLAACANLVEGVSSVYTW
jgi:hypothetical protein